MPKFYKHNVEESRKLRDGWRKQLADVQGRAYHANFAILQLQHVAEHGLPDCYTSFGDFLCDFYPDLSWNASHSSIEIQLILKDDRFDAIVDSIKKDWEHDMRAELQAALKMED